MSRFARYQAELLEALVTLAPEGAGELPSLSFSRPPQPELGDLALGAFGLAKALRQNPKAIAEDWAARVETARTDTTSLLAGLAVPLTKVDALGPYLNLTLDAPAFAKLVMDEIAEEREHYGEAAPKSGEKVLVEYSAPNSNKPLHLGHIRNNLIGMSLANVLAAAGHDVSRVNLVNDRGIQICKSMLAYQRFGEGETPEQTGEKGDTLVGRYYVLFETKLQEERTEFAKKKGIDLARFSKDAKAGLEKDDRTKLEKEEAVFEKDFTSSSELLAGAQAMLRSWEKEDAEVRALWKTMNEWVYAGFRATYERMGSKFDHWYYESETYLHGKDEVDRGLGMGVFERREDGSVWAKLSDVGLKDKILLRADGTSVYITQDIGTAVFKHRDYAMDRSVYVVGSEQQNHFRNLFAILRLLEFPWAGGCHHASYGLVTLPRGMGRLKSREGKAVDADDLLDELHGIAEAKIVEAGYCETAEAVDATAETIGQGALKMYMLQVSSEKSIVFDPNETISFTGDTGPAVQYSHARIQGIVRKGLADGILSEDDLDRNADGALLCAEKVDPARLVETEEKAVLRLLGDYPETVRYAAEQMSAAPVANYLLDLTKAYARMYHEHPVLKAEDAELRFARVQLALSVAQVLRNGLGLLTIEAPDRM